MTTHDNDEPTLAVPDAELARAQAAAELNEVLWPMEVAEKVTCGAGAFGCMVFVALWLYLMCFSEYSFWFSTGLAMLISMAPCIPAVIGVVLQDLITNRTVSRFNRSFPPGASTRPVAIEILQGMGERSQDYRKLVVALGATPRQSAPAVAAEQGLADGMATVTQSPDRLSPVPLPPAPVVRPSPSPVLAPVFKPAHIPLEPFASPDSTSGLDDNPKGTPRP